MGKYRLGRHNKELLYWQEGYEPADTDPLVLVAVGDDRVAARFTAMEAVDKLNEALVPTEPADRTIVVDRDGDAWQRNDGHSAVEGDVRWFCSHSGAGGPRSWADLINEYSPIKEVS